MKKGADIALAFAAALAAHAAIALALGDTGGPGENDNPGLRPTAAFDPAVAQLAAAWRKPPEVAAAPELQPRPTDRTEPVALPRAETPLPSRTAPDLPTDTPGADALPNRLEALATLPVPTVPDLAGVLPAPSASADFRVAAAGGRDAAVTRPAPTRPADPAASKTPVAADDLPPPPDPVVAEAPEPDRTRPRPRPTAATASPPRQAVASAAPSASRAGTAELDAMRVAWASAIRSKIARAQRHPGPRHGDGRVRLSLVVARDGRLTEARVATSSGSAVLDRAALEAAHRAAPFPRAPAELDEAWMRFGQWVAFRNK